jgi:hypothetical protein
LVAASSALLLRSAPGADAALVVYTFDPGTQLDFSNGDTDTLQGTITIDTTTYAPEYGFTTAVTLTGSPAEAGFLQRDYCHLVFREIRAGKLHT